MGATSVTGVSGPGTVAGLQKGSSAMSLSVKKLIGPHIVAAGLVAMGGSATSVVEIPAQGTPPNNSEFYPDSVSNYSIIVTSSTATATYVSTGLAVVSSTNTWTFTITSGTTATVSWIVVRNGL